MESPSMAEVGAPVILSLGVAGYCSVRRTADGAGAGRTYSSVDGEWLAPGGPKKPEGAVGSELSGGLSLRRPFESVPQFRSRARSRLAAGATDRVPESRPLPPPDQVRGLQLSSVGTGPEGTVVGGRAHSTADGRRSLLGSTGALLVSTEVTDPRSPAQGRGNSDCLPVTSSSGMGRRRTMK